MTGYFLSGEQSICIESGMIQLQVRGGSGERLRLEHGGRIEESGSQGWMAATIASDARLYVLRQDGTGHPSGQIHVSLKAGQDQVSLEVDATGHTSFLVMRLRPLGDGRLEVSSVAGVSLPALAGVARALASKELATHGAKADRGVGRDIAVTIDGSASMGWLTDDVVPGLLECLAGLDYLAGSDDALEVRLAGGDGLFTGHSAADVRSWFRSERSAVKGVVAPDLWVPPPVRGMCWVVVSDQVPADIPESVDLVVVLVEDERMRDLIVGPGSEEGVVLVSVETLRLDANGQARAAFKDFVQRVLRVVIKTTIEGVS